MTKLGPYEVHPFADAFPLIDGDEFSELVDDIERNGLREPIIVTFDGATLVDGRNRYRACQQVGFDDVEYNRLPASTTEADILDLILSVNVARRHLNPGQRAMVALEYERLFAATTKRGRPADATVEMPVDRSGADLRHSRAPRATDRAAKAVGASGRAVQQAKAVAQAAPDLAEKVRNGTVALDAAYKQTRQRERDAPRPEPAPKPSPILLTLRTHAGEPVAYPKPAGKATFNATTGPGISWAAWSWNPVTGCLHGCDYCYAREIATSERYKASFPAGFTPLFHIERLDAPANTTIPAEHHDEAKWQRVFVCSMADLYGRWVPDEWIAQVHASMLASPAWQYLLLTKFPARYVGLDLPPAAWVGTSVDEQKRVRIAEDAFRQIDGVKVKWLSLEPLREPLEFTDLSMFDWVVIGAQTETRQPTGVVEAFSPPAAWVARITHQALEAGCKVHWKPNLRTNPGMAWLDEDPS